MNAKKIASVVFIFAVTSIAWMVLGGTTSLRTDNSRSTLGSGNEDGRFSSGKSTIHQLWGTPQIQRAPTVWTTHIEKVASVDAKGKKTVTDVRRDDAVVLSKSRIETKIDLDQRRKGLLWYSTYKVKFQGDYAFTNEFSDRRTFYVQLYFPDDQVAFNNVMITVQGKNVSPRGNLSEGMKAPVNLNPGEAADVQFSYGSQGLDSWQYQFASNEAMSSVRDFSATVVTNCKDIDFPEKCLSPTDKTMVDNGWKLNWKYGDLVSGSKVGISMPQKLQPGRLASKISFFAPVSLFFFFAVLLILGAVKGVKLHPIHYLFMAATFFSFHLLFSYLVDHVAPFGSFLIASAVSLLLTISYIRLVVDWKFAIRSAGFWQFVFLVLFAYAFFFEGYTGLTITIGAILTLAAMMQLTGRVNWEEAFAENNAASQPPAPPSKD
ncbi:MAG: hypothetical protein GX139_08175 [Armatimonadetes bacterium]|jgi:inner membrane protein involved in colicin E2 resistance|nr:hypothetical protein [Armatimonadota bacterium]